MESSFCACANLLTYNVAKNNNIKTRPNLFNSFLVHQSVCWTL